MAIRKTTADTKLVEQMTLAAVIYKFIQQLGQLFVHGFIRKLAGAYRHMTAAAVF